MVGSLTERGKIQTVREIWLTITGFEDGGRDLECGCPLQAGISSHLTAEKETGTSVLQSHGTDFSQQPE